MVIMTKNIFRTDIDIYMKEVLLLEIWNHSVVESTRQCPLKIQLKSYGNFCPWDKRQKSDG